MPGFPAGVFSQDDLIGEGGAFLSAFSRADEMTAGS